VFAVWALWSARQAGGRLSSPSLDRPTLRRFVDACRAGQPAEVAALIDDGVDVNTALGPGPPDDPKPLLWTVRPARWTAGHRRVLELLLDAGADPNGGELSPVVAAAEQGHRTAVELLIARGARVGFYEAVAVGDLALVEAFLAEQPRLAAAVRPRGVGIHGKPGGALHFAALSKLEDADLPTVAERLLAAGAPVDGDPAAGVLPPLRWAARADNAAVAGVLLRNGAEPSPSALAAALMSDARRVVELLGPLVGRVDLPGDAKLGNSLLHETIRWGLLGSARWLVERGAAVDGADARGWTALHYACSRGVGPDLVALLLDRGGAARAPDAEGRTPLDLARENNRAALVELLATAPG
jgi:ankyrin repeat protein